MPSLRLSLKHCDFELGNSHAGEDKGIRGKECGFGRNKWLQGPFNVAVFRVNEETEVG